MAYKIIVSTEGVALSYPLSKSLFFHQFFVFDLPRTGIALSFFAVFFTKALFTSRFHINIPVQSQRRCAIQSY